MCVRHTTKNGISSSIHVALVSSQFDLTFFSLKFPRDKQQDGTFPGIKQVYY